MLKKSALVLFALLFAPGAGLADDASKKQKVEQLVQAMGIQDSFANMKNAQREQAKRMVQPLAQQVSREAILNSQEQARLQASFQSFIDHAGSNMTAEQFAATYADLYGSHFSEAEIDQILKFYTSDVGRKGVAAGREMTAELSGKMQKDSVERMTKAMAQLKSEIVAIVTAARARQEGTEGQGARGGAGVGK